MDNEMIITEELIEAYADWLGGEERAKNTIDKYRHDLKILCAWLDGRPVTKVLASEWKADLQARYAAASVNSMLAAANGFFRWMGWTGIKLKFLKIQRKVFCDKNRELDKPDYQRLIAVALSMGKSRLALLMEVLCGLGLRVSELKYITVEAAGAGRAEIQMKGKIRTVIISNKLARKLLKYAKKKNISSGEIFITKSGKSMSRGQIWQEMKKLGENAGVESEKVFPHNLRHLFARTYYRIYKDIAKLADILGHTSIETTRLYLISTGEEHAEQIESLGLVS
ncbi:MAG: site-specific integrase [Clostridiales bacterium]|nr:site-specific integrase [Clostridiales bacterium]